MELLVRCALGHSLVARAERDEVLPSLLQAGRWIEFDYETASDE